MNLEIITIVLNGMPFIERHLPVFEQLDFPWRWHVVEGVASNVKCTKWCQKIPAGLSTDGTTEYLKSIAGKNVHVYRKPLWSGGKVQMVNAPLATLKHPCVLMQVDADEIWTPDQLATITHILSDPLSGYTEMEFFCRYFVGPDLVTQGGYGNRKGEWRRAWRFTPNMRFLKHEPPIMRGWPRAPQKVMLREMTRSLGLVFDHYAYATAAQVQFKERFYGYSNALWHWQRLQQNQNWPARLANFLPWVAKMGDPAIVTKLT